MKAKYLIYFCYGIDSVFDSQVWELLKSVNDCKTFKNIYLIIGVKNAFEKEKIKKIVKPAGISLIIYKSPPNYPIFNFFFK